VAAFLLAMGCGERGLFQVTADHCSFMRLNALAGWHFIAIPTIRVMPNAVRRRGQDETWAPGGLAPPFGMRISYKAEEAAPLEFLGGQVFRFWLYVISAHFRVLPRFHILP
jgi:hypothetical protein